jgi:hypothetical protein
MKREMWVVYARPSDYPDKFVARVWEFGADLSPRPTEYFRLAKTLEDLRLLIPAHLVRLERDPKDEPQIVEVWV